jgi:hypothetical protein
MKRSKPLKFNASAGLPAKRAKQKLVENQRLANAIGLLAAIDFCA